MTSSRYFTYNRTRTNSEKFFAEKSIGGDVMKIFIMHHAGGSSSYYIKMKRMLEERGMECILLDLPGHGEEVKSSLLFQFDTAVGFLARKIKNSIEKNEEFIVLGHSLGGLLAYHVVRRLGMSYDIHAKHLFVMGCTAPGSEPNYYKIDPKEKDRQIFMKQVSGIGGVPEELLNSEQLLDSFYPIFRADFMLLETYVQFNPEPENKIDCNLTFMYGKEDRIVTQAESKKWESYTKGEYKVYPFSGEHFFYNQHLEEVCDIVTLI